MSRLTCALRQPLPRPAPSPPPIRACPVFGRSSMAWRPLGAAAAAGRAQATVAESLHLLSFPPGTSEEEVAQLVDGMWSLQYVAAGPICGVAGPLALAAFPPSGGAAAAASPQAPAPYSHAVLFRYASAASLERFEAQLRVQLVLGGSGAPHGTAMSTLNFLGCVPNELEAIFRRGGEWEAGLELVVALGVQEGSGDGDAEEFLSLAQQLALSSAFGAVQCSHGRCLSPPRHGAGGGGGQQQEGADGGAAAPAGAAPVLGAPDRMLLARFQQEQQLRDFLACPPIAALLEGDKRLPLRALWSCALEAAPSDSSTSSQVAGGLL